MKTLHFAATFAFTLLFFRPASAQLPATTPQGKWHSTTVRRIKEPLSRTIDQIAKESGVKLSVAPDLKELKAVVVVRDRPGDEVLNHLAQVFGCEWTAKPAEGTSAAYYLLQRKEDVEAWRKRYLRQRKLARQFSCEQQAVRAKKIIQALQAAGRGEKPVAVSPADPDDYLITPDLARKYDGYKEPLAQFLATLTPSQTDQIADYYGIWAQGNVDKITPPPLVLSTDELTEAQREFLSVLKSRFFAKDGSHQIPVQGLFIAVTAQHEEQLDIMWVSHRTDLGGYTNMGHGFGGFNTLGSYSIQIPTYTGSDLDKITEKDFNERMAAKPIPPDALLGANWAKEKQATEPIIPPLEISDDKAEVQKQMLKVPVPAPAGWRQVEVLQSIAEKSGRNIISDYFTRGRTQLDQMELDAQYIQRTAPNDERTLAYLHRQMTKMDDPKDDVLTRLARRTNSIIRVPPNYLLCRKLDWPLSDPAEIPYPLMENLIEEKRVYHGLFLESYSALCRLTTPQIYSLGYYNDGTTNLSHEVNLVLYNARAGQKNLAITALCQLPPATMELAMRPEGIALTALPPQTQRMLRSDGFTEDFGENTVLKIHAVAGKYVPAPDPGGKIKQITIPLVLEFAMAGRDKNGHDLDKGREIIYFDALQRPKDYVPAYQ